MSMPALVNGDTGLVARNLMNRIGDAAHIAIGGKPMTFDFFGDSIGAKSAAMMGGVFRSAACFWAPGLNIQIRDDYAVGGTSSTNLISVQGANQPQLTRFQTAITGGRALPDCCVIQTYSNDANINTDTDADTFLGYQTTFAQAVLAMGVKLVIFASALPRVTGSDPEGRSALNSKIARYCSLNKGCVFFDWHNSSVDPNTASTTVSPWNTVFNGFSSDGVHPSAGAHFYAGRELAAILSPVVGRVTPRTFPNIRYIDNADASWNPLNGTECNFLGTGGQLNGVNNTGVAGSAASQNNRWLIDASAGITVTPSIVTDDIGRRKQRMVISGTPSVANPEIRLRYNHNFLPTLQQRVQTQCLLDVVALTGCSGIEANSQGIQAVFNGTGVIPPHSGSYFLRNLEELPLVSPGGGGVNIDLVIYGVNGVPMSGTVDVSRFCVYRVE